MTITTLIIIGTCVISLAAMERQNIMPESLQRPEWTGSMKFNAYQIWHHGQIYRLLSHGLIHADLWHLAFNMITLYYFGNYVEESLVMLKGNNIGKLLYLDLYLTGLVVSSSVDLIRHRDHTYYNAVGASGAVSAALFAAILLNPSMKIAMLLIPIPMPGWVFGILYLLYCFYMAKRGGDNIGHTAHAMGAIYGIIYMLIAEPGLLRHFINTLAS